MSDHIRLVDDYIAVWNEADPGARRALIARTYTQNASYSDPMLASEGHDGIDAVVAGVQARFPGFRFRRAGDVEAHHDRLRFRWQLGPDGQAPVVEGTDVGIVVDGKLADVAGFFDRGPAMPAADA